MTAVALTQSGLKNVKRALAGCFRNSKSSHLTEALAVACGFRTHAALVARVRESNDPDIVVLDAEAFAKRLRQLENDSTPLTDDDLDCFDLLSYPSAQDVFKTTSPRYYEPAPTSKRYRAWRNLLVAGINAAIDRRLFTVRPGDNRWPGANIRMSNGHFRPHTFRFDVGNVPAIGYVSDAGWDELTLHVAFWPSEAGERWIQVYNPDFLAGEVFASGWLERRDGAWLQTANDFYLRCRNSRLDAVAALDIKPKGYADRGDFRM